METSPSAALSISHVSKTYANGKSALHDVNLAIQSGEFFGLLGANGAGKTTLIGILTGLVRKTHGRASVFGYDIDEQTLQAKLCIGVMPQEFNFNIFETVEDILINQAGFYGIAAQEARSRAEPLLHRLQLWEKRKQAARTLSGGMKRRLMLARSLIHHPQLLILDEPSAGVDVELRHTLWEYLTELNAQGTSIVLTTHYLEEAERLCERFAILHNGLIQYEANTRDIARTHPNLEALFLSVTQGKTGP